MMILIGKYLIIGLVGVLVIYLFDNLVLQHTIRKAPDYYEKHEIEQDAEMIKNIKTVDETFEEAEK